MSVTPKKIDPALRDRAVRLVREHRSECPLGRCRQRVGAPFGTADHPERSDGGGPFSDANGAVRAEAVRIFRAQVFESGGG